MISQECSRRVIFALTHRRHTSDPSGPTYVQVKADDVYFRSYFMCRSLVVDVLDMRLYGMLGVHTWAEEEKNRCGRPTCYRHGLTAVHICTVQVLVDAVDVLISSFPPVRVDRRIAYATSLGLLSGVCTIQPLYNRVYRVNEVFGPILYGAIAVPSVTRCRCRCCCRCRRCRGHRCAGGVRQ